MIKQLIATLAIVTCVWNPAPVQATSVNDVKELVQLIKGTGTDVVHGDCEEPNAYGYYTFSKEEDIDQVFICSSRVDMNDPNEVWDVLAHEATHVMQACQNDNIIKLEKHPAVLRELQDSAPHLYQNLQAYTGRHKLYEAEAFWMMLRSPSIVKEWFYQACYKSAEEE